MKSKVTITPSFFYLFNIVILFFIFYRYEKWSNRWLINHNMTRTLSLVICLTIRCLWTNEKEILEYREIMKAICTQQRLFKSNTGIWKWRWTLVCFVVVNCHRINAVYMTSLYRHVSNINTNNINTIFLMQVSDVKDLVTLMSNSGLEWLCECYVEEQMNQKWPWIVLELKNYSSVSL